MSLSGKSIKTVVAVAMFFFVSSLGRYKDAVARYQAVKPLTVFRDVCGLALSLFMAGQSKDSYQGD